MLFEIEKLKEENRNFKLYIEINTTPLNCKKIIISAFNSNGPHGNGNINLKYLKNKIEELEDLLSQYKNNCSPQKLIELEDSLISQYDKIIVKDKLIETLQIKLKEYLNKNHVIFDEKQAVYSLTQALREKDIMIINLKMQIREMRDTGVKASNIDSLSRNADKHFDSKLFF